MIREARENEARTEIHVSHLTKKRPRRAPSDPIEKSSKPKPSTTQSDHIRSKFLNRLGISQSPPLSPTSSKSVSERPVVSIKAPLKNDSGGNDLALSPTGVTQPMRARSVSFESSVTVHPIPMRNEYSDRLRRTIWTSSKEMQQMASRNAYEFAHENWNWRQVAEDKDMIKLSNGEMVHPVHYIQQSHYGGCNLQRQFLMVLSAQRNTGICHN
eukprot:CAMPEP_0194047852 /NCGR_PEP_ID=MMETSP0009_2-20130614/25839_1 /TAXON_ID=210454 /ORGANISM="Grammatophora oceanica, Strain CCMP 410" /LENGTH=212 /DNA_ID=CAMNT_0038693577 /DNA_START=101 /DNA_END=739 /DNA_ORIENTATION=-